MPLTPLLILLVGLFLSSQIFAQTGIGTTTPHASAKLDGEGDKDLYMLEIKKVVEEKPLTVMSGTFSIGDANNTVPPDAQIIVTDNETGDLVGVFRPNQKTGKYKMYYDNGKIKEEGQYHNDHKVGIWKSYDLNGKVIKEDNYDKK